ncbi:MAG: NAD(P)H-quinone oxidoreductase [Deltaproteobacteria bacterium]|nr:NAD(P)H-quinone oxidoreductase [Deltaproteobacteria bacterium]
MRAVVFDRPGDESGLHLGEVPTPAPGPRQIRLRVAATAVNRADLLQRRGSYPPPPGESDILGLECAGTVDAVGPGATRFAPGDRVMALLAGGGYAEAVVCDERVALPVPAALGLEEAAAVPEVFLTVWLTVFSLGAARAGETLLVHGGGSGVGTAAIQLGTARGLKVLCTAGTDAKVQRCREAGAAHACNYRTEDFGARVAAVTEGRGVDLVLDSIGGPYLEANLRSLAPGGRLVLIGVMGGKSAPLDLGLVVRKRLQVIGSTLRSRPLEEKAALCADFELHALPLFASGRCRPVVDRVLPLAEVAAAHRVVAASEHFGKVVLRVS